MDWETTELQHLDIDDKRLAKRAEKILRSFFANPKGSIPKACRSWSETLATYRFLSNEAITYDDLMTSHYTATECRIREQEGVILCVQDTTELDFTGKTIEGMGRLSYKNQRGFYSHPTLCLTPERVSLGLVDNWLWVRELDKNAESIKESQRWIEGYERVAELAQRCPQQRLVYVADREADCYELFATASQQHYPADLLIRATHNRSLAEGGKLWESVANQAVLTRIHFLKPRKAKEKARPVTQEIKVLRYMLQRKGKPSLTLTLLQAEERDPPPGHNPLVWRLVTNREVITAQDAAELIDWYRARWEIEMFFAVLKVGCRVESLQLDTLERVQKALALYLMVAWRIMFLMRIGRACPDLPADLVFDEIEWQVSYLLDNKPVPKKIPTINEVLRNIAKLGGFLGRKSDGEPGAESIWLGYSRVLDCIHGILIAEHVKKVLNKK